MNKWIIQINGWIYKLIDWKKGKINKQINRIKF